MKMGSFKMAFGTIILLCVSTACVALATDSDDISYSIYDAPSFSVEYPSNWDVERSLAAEYEGWEYSFKKYDIPNKLAHYFSLTTGTDKIRLDVVVSLNSIEGGTFDNATRHFLDTLNFKNGSNETNATQNVTYASYDNAYFSAEYPQNWRTDRTETRGGDIWYAFFDDSGSSIQPISVSFTTLETSGTKIDIALFQINVPRDGVSSGKFEEPILHFFNTLMFKM